ncbi:Tyrosine aminotransferase [Acropora cervicornis]|uniref:Tyrosine aminotransferase n=1 Tax=Acropora cervicornis TaxID=6130 RepID=A0AAD9UUU9_ACRCE|nr:Tyrosine aminotransferase [Acropora cervicornis]
MSSAKRRRWHIPASFTARTTFNPIRSIVDRMKISPNPEKQMIALSIGDPSVFGNLDPCNEMVDSVVNCIKKAKHNGYSPSTGYVKTREAIAAEHSYPLSPLTYKDVVLACGCSGALELALDVLLNPGDNVLLPKPGFSIYQTISISRGHEVRHYNLLPERSWEVDIDHLESLVDDRTRAIVVNNPSNPCGSVYTKKHLEAILEAAEKYMIPVVADEVYENVVFPGYKFYPLAQLSENVPILTCGGISKGYLVPGWRLGWVIIHDKHGAFESEASHCMPLNHQPWFLCLHFPLVSFWTVRQGLVAMSQQILGPNTLIQGALPDILAKTPQSYFENTVKVIQCFQYPNYFRIVLTVPAEMTQLACKRINEFCRSHRRSDSKNSA